MTRQNVATTLKMSATPNPNIEMGSQKVELPKLDATTGEHTYSLNNYTDFNSVKQSLAEMKHTMEPNKFPEPKMNL